MLFRSPDKSHRTSATSYHSTKSQRRWICLGRGAQPGKSWCRRPHNVWIYRAQKLLHALGGRTIKAAPHIHIDVVIRQFRQDATMRNRRDPLGRRAQQQGMHADVSGQDRLNRADGFGRDRIDPRNARPVQGLNHLALKNTIVLKRQRELPMPPRRPVRGTHPCDGHGHKAFAARALTLLSRQNDIAST